MNNLLIKIFSADSKELLEMRMNTFLITVPQSYLRDLGYSHSLDKDGNEFYSAIIAYEKRVKLTEI